MITHLTRVVLAIAAGIGALAFAAPAHADQYDYVSYLDSEGVYYSSISGVIDAGKMTCRILRSGGGVPAALGFLTRAGYERYESATIVVSAVDHMCPDTQPVIDAFLHPAGNGNVRT